MTKMKNTKKGMAKKALSISLVAAMLATSNVPVWAAFEAEDIPVLEQAIVNETAFESAESTELPSNEGCELQASENFNVSLSGTTEESGGTEVKVGEPLTVNINYTGDISDNPSVTYQWYKVDTNGNEEELLNATTKTYTVSDDDAQSFNNSYLYCKISPVSEGVSGEAISSKPVKVIQKSISNYTDLNNQSEMFVADMAVGSTITAPVINNWKGSSISYTWKCGDTILPEETGNTYTITKENLGEFISVIVEVDTKTATYGSLKKELTSEMRVDTTDKTDWYGDAGLVITQKPEGDFVDGQKLDADISLNDPSFMSVVYFWYKDGELIDDASDSSYPLSREDVGSTFYVKAKINYQGDYTTVQSSPVTIQGTTIGTQDSVTWVVDGKTTKETPEYTYKKGCDYRPDIVELVYNGVTYKKSNSQFENVTYSNSTKAGTAYVNVKLTNTNSSADGTVLRFQYTIHEANLKNTVVKLSSDYVYAPAGLENESLENAGLTVTLDDVTLVAVDGATDPSSDKYKNADVLYTLTASAAGQNKGSIVITPKDANYIQSKTLTFDVEKKDVSEIYVKAIEDRIYNGYIQEPTLNDTTNSDGVYEGALFYKEGTTDDNNKGLLTPGTDFKVEWDDSLITIGTKTGTVTGLGNYTGTTQVSFDIVNAKVDMNGLLEIIVKGDGNKIQPLGTFVNKNGSPISTSNLDADAIKEAISDGAYFKFTYSGATQNPILSAYGMTWTEGDEYTYTFIGQHKNVGDFTIKVEGLGKYASSSFKLPCTIVPYDIRNFTLKTSTNKTGEIEIADTVYNNNIDTNKKVQAIEPEVTINWNKVALESGIDFTVDYSIATLNAYNNGKIPVSITGKNNFTGSITTGIYGNVIDKELDSADITPAAIENKKYTGSSITLNTEELETLLKDGKKYLVPGTDFHVIKYSNNTKPGVATVTLGGSGHYTGTLELTFLIVDAEYNASIINVNGGSILPSVSYDYTTANSKNGFVLDSNDFKVIDNETGSTIDSSKYTVTYEDNRAAGTATITITGKAGYEISAINTFVIKPMTLTTNKVTASTFKLTDGNSFTYTGDAIEPSYEVTIKDGKYSLVEGTDYEIIFENNTDVAGSSDKDAPVVKLIGLGNYAGLDGNKKLPEFDRAFTIRKATLSGSEIIVNNVAYAGGMEVTPDITITNPVSGKELVLGTDYEVKYTEGGKNLGTAALEITLIGDAADNYELRKEEVRFNIVAKDLDDVNISAIADQVFTGEQIKPAIAVSNGSVRMVEGTDYEVVYGENTAVGEGTVTIKALDSNKNYTGSQTVKFNIVKVGVDVPEIIATSDPSVDRNIVNVAVTNAAEDTSYDYVLCTSEEDLASLNFFKQKNNAIDNTQFQFVRKGTYYVYARAIVRDENGKTAYSNWSEPQMVTINTDTPNAPTVTNVTTSGNTVTVTYVTGARTEGVDVILGTAVRKQLEDDAVRPVNYNSKTGLRKNVPVTTKTVTFTNVAKGTYYVGVHPYITSSDGLKYFGRWSKQSAITQVTVK